MALAFPMFYPYYDPLRLSYDPNGNLTIGGPALVSNIQAPIIPMASPFPSLIRPISNPNADPKLRHDVVKYYYDRLKTVYLPASLSKLLKYIAVRNGAAALVTSEQEYDNNSTTHNVDLRVKYIMDTYFSKYDLEVVMDKVVNEFGLNWYELKSKHSSEIKKAIYRKIRRRIERDLSF